MGPSRSNFHSDNLSQARRDAKDVIRATEKALKKHLSLVKKREHISSIVAIIEQLRGDMRGSDAGLIRGHISKLNELTKGFVIRTLYRTKE